MTHQRKVDAYRKLMDARGVGRSTAVPPLWELLWRLGLHVPPPLFMGFVPLSVLMGSGFGTLFGVFAWITGNRGFRSMPLAEAGWVALLTGAAFGLATAWYCRRLARRQRLGPWAEFNGAGSGE